MRASYAGRIADQLGPGSRPSAGPRAGSGLGPGPRSVPAPVLGASLHGYSRLAGAVFPSRNGAARLGGAQRDRIGRSEGLLRALRAGPNGQRRGFRAWQARCRAGRSRRGPRQRDGGEPRAEESAAARRPRRAWGRGHRRGDGRGGAPRREAPRNGQRRPPCAVLPAVIPPATRPAPGRSPPRSSGARPPRHHPAAPAGARGAASPPSTGPPRAPRSRTRPRHAGR